MKNQKNCVKKRLLSLFLTLIIVIGLLPYNAFAVQKDSFVLVVEAGGELVIAPEYVSYEAGQTIREALLASGHTFLGINDDWITQIDGVTGNYFRSDEDGEYNLNQPAFEVSFYRFSENEESKLTDGLMNLMTAMAEYKNKPADVQIAAKEAYDTAYAQFVGLDSASASVLADELNTAIASYESIQNGPKHQVRFTDGQSSYSDTSITVVNAYGKEWADDGDGILSLPAGSYSFCINKDGLWAKGQIKVSDAMTVTVALPKQQWLDLEAFRLSGSYGAEKEEENKFTDDEYTLGIWDGRSVTVPVSDSFTGKIYTFAKYQGLSEIPTLTAIYNSAKNGEEKNVDIPFESFVSGASDILKKGSKGNTVIYRVSSKATDGYTYAQDYTVHYTRVPSLKDLKVMSLNGTDQAATTAFKSDVNAYTYKVLDTVTSVKIMAEPLDSTYEVLIDGQDASDEVTIKLSESKETVIPVVVRFGDYSNTYTLTIQPGEGKALSFVTERPDVTLEVSNQNGQILPYEKFREGANGNRYQYTLVPGETYRYVATAAKYYHIADEFTMEDAADSTIRVDVQTEDWLSALAFGTGKASGKKDTLPLDTPFSPSQHSYEGQYVDTEHNAYIWASAQNGVKIQALYTQTARSALYHGILMEKDLTSGYSTGVQLNRFLMDENPLANTITIRLSKEVSGTTYYQDYEVAFSRILTLKNLSAKCDGIATSLTKENGSSGFASDVKEYSITVSMAASVLELTFDTHSGDLVYGEESIGYLVEVDGTDVTEQGSAQISLDGTLETQHVTVAVKNDKAPKGTTEYKLHILKSPPVDTAFTLTPQNAMLTVYEVLSGERLWPTENGSYQFCEGYKYKYTLTSFGHVSKSGILEVTRDASKALVVYDGDTVYPVTESESGGGALTIAWELLAAKENTQIQKNLTSEWKNFRGNDENNGVTDAKIPNAAENGTLYWANRIGKGYSADAVGSPILVDGDLITYAGSKIYRVDTVNGKIKVTGDMDHKSAHATTPPSYAEGMVFVALTDGTVQAFNAKTLESLWIYKDELGGQPVCPLTIKNGYLYTGFWNSETDDANFVCLSITDEDVTKGDEQKCSSWHYTSSGGYYWAGAYASDEYVIMGTDDGTAFGTGQSSQLLLFDPMSGKLFDQINGLNGDIRSSIVYDKVTNSYYFTSKGGSFYSVQVEQTEDGWKFSNLWNVSLTNGTEGTPMSTSSPSVYNGRAYVGVSGASQFSAYSGHNITVIDLNKKAIAYNVPTQGYPQTSGLLTTAYEEESGYVYVYFFDNMTPGKLRVIRDKAGQTSASYMTTEGDFTTAYALFTPTDDHAQYAICSPIVDEYGTVYFKNDSAHMMAFGSSIEKIEVTALPDKMVYEDGEAFDPTGMVVTAYYSNGKTREITDYVTYDAETITADHKTVTISFPYVMYHNEEDGTSMLTGINSLTPVTSLKLKINEEEPSDNIVLGDVTMDGAIDNQDAKMIISYFYDRVTFTEEQLDVADVNKDGEIDTIDAALIVSYFNGKITQFS